MSPGPDLDRAMRQIAAQVVVDPSAWTDIERRIRARHRRRTATYVAAISAVVLAVSVVVPRVRAPETFVTGPGDGWAVHTDDRLRASFRYPRGWNLQTFSLWRVAGIVVTNLGRDLAHPDLGEGSSTSAWDFRRVPSSVVAVQISLRTGGPMPRPSPGTEDTSFPLALDVHDRRTLPPPINSYGAPPHVVIPLVIDGDGRYSVLAWLGEDASEADLDIAHEIVGSIRFAHGEQKLADGCDADCAPPLTRQQQDLARAAALADDDVRARLKGKRYRVVGFHPYRPDEKATGDPCRAKRCIDVVVYMYSDDRVLDVFVDESDWHVVDIRESPGTPPLGAEESLHARSLAEADGRVREVLRDERDVESHPARLVSTDTGACAKHRCGIVMYLVDWDGERSTGRQMHVIVDLSADSVIHVEKKRCDARGCSDGW